MMDLQTNPKCTLIEKDSDTYNQVMDTPAHITWCLCGHQFLIQSEDGKTYIFSDSDYPNGTDDLYLYNGNYDNWCKELGIPYGRDKGHRAPIDYFGLNGHERQTYVTEALQALKEDKSCQENG